MLRTLLWGVLVLLSGPLQAEVTLRLDPVGWIPNTQRDVAVVIETTSAETPLEGPPAKLDYRVPVLGGTSLDLPSAGPWRVAVDEPDLWSPPREIRVGSTASIDLPVFRAGVLEGTLALPNNPTLPETIEVRIATPPATQPRVQETVARCPVAKRRFACRLPAVPLDLRVEVEGYVPHYFWAVRVPVGEAESLGTLHLQRGASVIGRVEAPQRGFDFAACDIEIQPVAAGFSGSKERQRQDRRKRNITVDEHGFFQFSGVAPGSYTVAVRHPHYALAKHPPFQVEADRETELPTSELLPPSILRLVVDPPTDPYRRPWRVQLHQRGVDPAYLDQANEGETTAEGARSVYNLDLEAHWLTLLDSRGATWERTQVTPIPGELEIHLEVPLERLEGHLLLAEEPVANAQVVFSEARGGARTVVRSNDDGVFYVFLPQGRKWTLDVTQRTEGINATFEDVTIPPKQSGEPWPRKELVLPDTRVEGEVVTPEGLPLERAAMVDLWRDARSTSSQATREDGRFVLRGIDPGTFQLEARQLGSAREPSRRSQRLQIKIEEETPIEALQLVLRDDSVVEGQVVSVGGQRIAGARILATVEHAAGSAPRGWWLPETESDADGVFRFELPPTAQAAWLTTLAPGFAVTQTRVEVGMESPAMVVVDPVGGTLSVTFDDAPVALRDQLKGRTSITGKAPLQTTFALMDWARIHGVTSTWDRLEVPMLEPGPYEVCLRLDSPTELGASPCVGGELPPHGLLELRLPVQVDTTQ